ncbi:MAG: response regulator transcription factor [Prevotella sp.]|nr:response regulator transcription factor [Prevotella sp.]
MIKLLLVEDDANLAYMEKNSLEEIVGGYEVRTAGNGKEGLKAYAEFKPDVIVSDIKMPEMDGLEMVKRIRETDGDTVILFTTALTSSADLKAGYLAGANNYIKKPFMPDEINAHVQSLMKLKYGQRSNNESGHIVFGKYVLDASHACLTDRNTGNRKMLTQREAQVLELLAANKNEVVRREALLSRFWGIENKDYFASRSLDVFIKKIRTAIEDDTSIELKTIRGVGLMLQTKD